MYVCTYNIYICMYLYIFILYVYIQLYDIMYINYICACVCICMCMLKIETVHKFNGPSNNKSNIAKHSDDMYMQKPHLIICIVCIIICI